MQQEYEQREDHRFGLRFMVTMFAASIPVWIALTIPFVLGWPLIRYGIGLLITLPISLLFILWRFRFTQCPNCGRVIRVPWRSREFRRGGMLRYDCDHCRIVWATHLYPGSDI